MAGAGMAEDDTEDRIRAKAHALWESEGRPHGRAEAHWVAAREMVAIEDSHEATLKPLPERAGEPVEPVLAAENLGDLPSLTDQGDQIPTPSLEVAADHADDRPESGPDTSGVAAQAPKRTRRPAAEAGETGSANSRSSKAKSAKAGTAPAKADAAGQFAKSRGTRTNDGLASATPVATTGTGEATHPKRLGSRSGV